MRVVGSHEPVGGGPSTLLNLCLWQPLAGRASRTGFLRPGRSLQAVPETFLSRVWAPAGHAVVGYQPVFSAIGLKPVQTDASC